MPAPTEDENVVVPLHLQSVVDRPDGWRDRSASLVAIALVGFVVLGVILGRSLDTGPSRPPVAAVGSVLPTATARLLFPPTPIPTSIPTALATPLPQIEVTGSRLPTERRFVYADGLRVLDLATGTLQPTTRHLYDALPVGEDEVVCACSLGGIFSGDPTQPPSLRFGRYHLDGSVILERELLSFEDVVPVHDMTSGVNIAVALTADDAIMYMLVTARRPPSWWIDLYEVRVASGQIVGHSSLGRLPVDVDDGAQASPSPSAPGAGGDGQPPDGTYVWPDGLAVAPGGRTLYARVADQEIRAGEWSGHYREWMIPVRAGRPGEATWIRSADTIPADDWCLGAPRFVDPGLLVQACAAAGAQGPPTAYYVRRLRADGTSPGDLRLDGFSVGQAYAAATLLDVRARALYVWDAVEHALGRIDLDSGEVALASVPASALPPEAGAGTGRESGVDPGLVESPDGTRLYALGMLWSGGRRGRSTGIWVFDARTLASVDHWAPRALLTSLAVSADGTFVYAAGAQGADADGYAHPWPASVTVYDATSGEIQVLYGSVSADTSIAFRSSP
jgi:hypothetical protein